jgi:arginine transport system substrate-binding protein
MENFFTRVLFALFILNILFASLRSSDFVVGTTSGYAPFVSLDEDGKYVGFDIDFSQALGKKLNRTVIFKDLGSMPALMLALKQEKIDAIIWAISITEERQKQMDMVFYQGEKVTTLPLIFWKEIPKEISCLQDMAKMTGAVICTEAGSFQDSFLQTVPGLCLKQVDKVTDAILEIRYGKSIASLVDPSLLGCLTEQFPELKVMEVALPPSQQSLGNGICLNKKNSALTAQVRQAVSELEQEGKIKELEKKWGLG